MRTFLDGGPQRCTNATQSGVVDWVRLRQKLAEYRHAKHLDVKVLADKIGVKPSTIYRIENVDKAKSHRPKLQTISDWLEETTDITLSKFFSQIETQSAEPASVPDERATVEAAPHVQTIEEDLAESERTTRIVGALTARLDKEVQQLKREIRSLKRANKKENRRRVRAASEQSEDNRRHSSRDPEPAQKERRSGR